MPLLGYVKVLHEFKIAIFAMIILGTFENYFCTWKLLSVFFFQLPCERRVQNYSTFCWVVYSIVKVKIWNVFYVVTLFIISFISTFFWSFNFSLFFSLLSKATVLSKEIEKHLWSLFQLEIFCIRNIWQSLHVVKREFDKYFNPYYANINNQ